MWHVVMHNAVESIVIQLQPIWLHLSIKFVPYHWVEALKVEQEFSVEFWVLFDKEHNRTE